MDSLSLWHNIRNYWLYKRSQIRVWTPKLQTFAPALRSSGINIKPSSFQKQKNSLKKSSKYSIETTVSFSSCKNQHTQDNQWAPFTCLQATVCPCTPTKYSATTSTPRAWPTKLTISSQVALFRPHSSVNHPLFCSTKRGASSWPRSTCIQLMVSWQMPTS